jgi:microcystin-dependent protein
MPELPNVVATETITSEYTNLIRDRTLQRYASVTDRTSEHAAPDDGDLSFIENTGDVDVYYSGGWRHIGSPVGTVEMQAGATVPPGWLVCNGQAVSRTTYAALFAYYGTAWGAGDGSTTFNLPDLRQRFPIGVAASGTANALGAVGGAIDHRHTGPSHVHSGPSHTHSQAATLGPSATNDVDEYDGGVIDTVASSGHTHGNTNTNASGTANTGASGTANTGLNNPPFAALHFRVKT